METRKKPNYKKIYHDIINLKYPEKMNDCNVILSKSVLKTSDVLKLNTLIFSTNTQQEKQRNSLHRSYDMADILEILDYQKKNKLNNTQLADHFKLSKNSVTKWKKRFLI